MHIDVINGIQSYAQHFIVHANISDGFLAHNGLSRFCEQVQFPCSSLQAQTETNWEHVQFPCSSLQAQTETNWEHVQFPFLSLHAQTESELNWDHVRLPCSSLQDQKDSETNWEKVQLACVSLQAQTEMEQKEDSSEMLTVLLVVVFLVDVICFWNLIASLVFWMPAFSWM